MLLFPLNLRIHRDALKDLINIQEGTEGKQSLQYINVVGPNDYTTLRI